MSFIIVFASSHAATTGHSLLQPSWIQQWLVAANDYSAFSFGWGLLVASLLIITLALTRRTYLKCQLQHSHQLEQQRSIISQQKEAVITHQEQRLQTGPPTTRKVNPFDAEHLANMYQELTQANQDIEIFLYKAYHNFLGPIATIRGICNVAAMESKETRSLDYFDKVSTVADNMQDMLEQLLEVSVVHDRELVIESRPLTQFLEAIKSDLSDNTPYQTIRLDKQFPETVQLPVDEFLLRQAIFKIINNTAPFRRAGFNDTLEMVVSYQEKDDDVIITFKDHHLNIPAEVCSDIFRMFYRGSLQPNDHGLGLYTARYAMRRMGGDISLTTSNRCAAFHLRLPKHFNHQYHEFLEVMAGSSM